MKKVDLSFRPAYQVEEVGKLLFTETKKLGRRSNGKHLQPAAADGCDNARTEMVIREYGPIQLQDGCGRAASQLCQQQAVFIK